ncbi:flagellar protein FlgN [Rhodocyclaceae bacterium]
MATPTLGDALGAELGKLKEFIALLQQEQDLLKAGNTEALLPLIDTKTLLSNALASYAAARETVLKQLGLPAGRSGMESWLKHHGQPAHQQAWQTLLKLAADARELNLLNGKLIGLHMSHNQQAFNALMSATDRAMTYGPDGQRHSGGGGRILGTA